MQQNVEPKQVRLKIIVPDEIQFTAHCTLFSLHAGTMMCVTGKASSCICGFIRVDWPRSLRTATSRFHILVELFRMLRRRFAAENAEVTLSQCTLAVLLNVFANMTAERVAVALELLRCCNVQRVVFVHQFLRTQQENKSSFSPKADHFDSLEQTFCTANIYNC